MSDWRTLEEREIYRRARVEEELRRRAEKDARELSPVPRLKYFQDKE